MTNPTNYPEWFYYPSRTRPPDWVHELLDVVSAARPLIDSATVDGLTSDKVLAHLRPGLLKLGYEVEGGKHRADKIRRPVLFGDSFTGNLRLKGRGGGDLLQAGEGDDLILGGDGYLGWPTALLLNSQDTSASTARSTAPKVHTRTMALIQVSLISRALHLGGRGQAQAQCLWTAQCP